MPMLAVWRPASVANSTALRFSTGKAPGIPRHTGQTLVLGGAPKRVEQEQKIFDAVRSWTCTSSPMTGSYVVEAATEVSAEVDISGDYNGSGQWTVISGQTAISRKKLRREE